MDEARLERIEEDLDKLSDAVVTLARMDEKMVTLFKRIDRSEADLRELVRQVAALERVSIGRGLFFRSLDKAIWLVAGGAVTFFVAYLQGAG